MPVRIYIQISIVFADARNLPTPLTHEENHYQRIRVLEIPDDKFSRWELFVSESIVRKESQLTTILSAEESKQLSALLQQIPAENMFSRSGMMDGAETEMLVIHKDKTVSFQWELPPWEPPPWESIPSWKPPTWVNSTEPDKQETSMESWAGVGAVADFILQVIEKHRGAL